MTLQVIGRSMEPAVSDGAVLRSGGRPSSIARGDVLVCRVEASAMRDVKRVVGLPGEAIAWDGQGRIWINGQLLEEPYARFGPVVPGDDDVQHAAMRADEYFMAGDHRLHSRDSRVYGAVPRARLLERVRAVRPVQS